MGFKRFASFLKIFQIPYNTHFEHSLDTTTYQVKVWADIPFLSGSLLFQLSYETTTILKKLTYLNYKPL